MFASILVILLSLALLVYWLRYTSLLLVKEVASNAQLFYPIFSFPLVRAQLRAGMGHASLQKGLDRDYAVLAYLIDKTPVAVETKLLVWDYRLVRCWYALVGGLWPTQAGQMVGQMADILNVLSSKLTAATIHA
jgi:hypothetical protein